MLLHIGCKIAQDTHLPTQLLRDSGYRECKVLAVGWVVMHCPGGEQNMSFRVTQHQTTLGTAFPPPPPTHGGTAYLWLGDSIMCVPLLKRTPMLWLESW